MFVHEQFASNFTFHIFSDSAVEIDGTNLSKNGLKSSCPSPVLACGFCQFLACKTSWPMLYYTALVETFIALLIIKTSNLVLLFPCNSSATAFPL